MRETHLLSAFSLKELLFLHFYTYILDSKDKQVIATCRSRVGCRNDFCQ